MNNPGDRHNQAIGDSKSKQLLGFFLRSAYRLRSGLVPKGFTVLFAALIGALLLAVGLAIFDIIFKEVSFATVVRDSNYAIYAADAGAECALFWDTQCTAAGVCRGSQAAFATSSASATPASGAGLTCDGQDIVTANPSVVAAFLNGKPQFDHGTQSATTTFAIYLDSTRSVPYCAVVQIIKQSAGSILSTYVISHGYNTCDTSNTNRIERAYLLSY